MNQWTMPSLVQIIGKDKQLPIFDDQMGIKESQVTGPWLFIQNLVQANNKEAIDWCPNATLLTLYEGNPPVTGGFPAQIASYVEGVYMSCYHE